MKISPRRRRRLLAGATAVLSMAGAIAVGPAAEADTVQIEGEIPQEVIDEFASCPAPELFTANPLYCLKLTAYDGELKLGGTVAQIDDPIEVVVGIGAGNDAEGNLVTEIVPAAGGSGGPATVPIPGGLLGLSELDDLIAATGPLLSVSAAPVMGSPGLPEGTELAFLSWLGAGADDPVTITLPLSIKLNNLVLGNKCHIDEFAINLTTGSTAPPTGVEPLLGESGDYLLTRYTGDGSQVFRRVGARFVDNGFAVSAPEKCDLLVGDVLDQPAGLLDPIVASQAGLPASAGTNYAAFSIDTAMVNYNVLDSMERSPGFVLFSSTAIGQTSETHTVTFEGTGRMFPTQISSVGVDMDDFEVVTDGCTGAGLARGEQCVVEVRYTPVTPGMALGNLTVESSSGRHIVGMMGMVAP